MGRACIAVVVPVYNRAKTVLETLTAITQQTVLPHRLIVVDDGSSDGTAASVRGWITGARPDFEAIVVEQSNQGAGAARNRGLREVGNCKYVAFLDSDDRWPSDFLARAVAGMEANPAAVAITADRIYHRKWKQRLGRKSCRGLERNATIWLLTNNSGIASCTLFRRAIPERLGGFNPHLPTGQDVEFFLRFSLEGPWLHSPGKPVQFYVGFTTANGEAGNLSLKYADRWRRRVRIRERFVFLQGGDECVSRRFRRRLFAHDWHKTGSMYRLNGRDDLAIACYHKALTYLPLRVSTWFRLISLRTKLLVTAALGSKRRQSPMPNITKSDAPAIGPQRLAG
jgi:glycosyltransferase involved in cell wall biosynthesis